MELHEVIQRAQVALEQGDYPLAVAACTHALESYPACVGAHRALGEALLEQGEVDRAVEHFEQTLRRDPLNLVARLGLGVASEERNDPETAYAHYTTAWDLNPALDQLRDELARLRMALGLDSRLHPTRAGLASIYLRGGQLGRAASEWRAVLAAEPDGDRAPVALAEVLWRQGDDTGAAAACQEALRRTPENARALALLAEIEHRRQAPTAAETLERYRAVDPGGDLALVLSDARPAVDLGFLLRSAPIDDFVFQPPAPAAEPPPLPPVVKTNGGLPASHLPAPDLWDTIVRDLGGDVAGLNDAVDALVVPFDWTEGTQAAPDQGELFLDQAASALDPFDLAAALADAPFAEPVIPPDAPVAALALETVAVATAESNGVARSENGFADVAAGLADVADAMAAAGGGVADGGMADGELADPFITADGRIDLTVGWDDLDRVLDEATPAATSHTGFTDIMAEIDAGGIAPFSTEDGSSEEAAWEPFDASELIDPVPAAAVDDVAGEPFAVDDTVAAIEPPAIAAVAAPLVDEVVAPPVAAVAPPAPAPERIVAADPLSRIAENWDRIDEELEAAIPTQQSSGYTDILRNIDQEGIMPFGVVDPDADVDPLAQPDAVGQPLDFDDLMTVTSRDSTGHLPRTAVPPATIADDVAGLVAVAKSPFAPFAVDEPPATAATIAAADYFADLDAPPVPVDLAPLAAAAIAPPPERIELAATAHQPAAETAGSNGNHGAHAWPTFVGGTSELIDRDTAIDGLFARVRGERDGLLAAGAVVVDLSLRSVSAAGWSSVTAGQVFRLPTNGSAVALTTAELLAPPASPSPIVPLAPAPDLVPVAVAEVRAPVATAVAEPDDLGLDLVEMRERLKLGRDEAQAVASELEAAIAAGRLGPLLARVLGEAYLKLGRADQAAAQFRQAIALRGRRR